MRKAYRRQPPKGAKVDTGSPFGKNITAHFLFNGDFRSAVRGKTGNPVVTTGPVIAGGPRGQYALCNGTGKVSTNLTASKLGWAGSAPRTVIAEFYMSDTSAQRLLLGVGDQTTHTHSQFAIVINRDYRGMQVSTYGDDYNFYLHNVGGTGYRVFFAVTYDGNLTISVRAWSTLDSTGQVIPFTGTYTLSAPLATGNTYPLDILGGGPYNTTPMNTAAYYLSLYGGRCLSPAEIDRLYVDRHQVIAPIPTFPYESLSLALTPVGPATIIGDISDSIVISDTLISQTPAASTVMDNLVALDSATWGGYVVGQINDVGTINDSTSSTKSTSSTVPESVIASDNFGSSAIFAGSIIDNLSAVDSIASTLQGLSAIADAIAVYDTVTVGTSVSVVSVSESVQITDTNGSTVVWSATVSDTVILSESLQGSSRQIVSFLESLGIIDQSYIAGTTYSSSVSDVLTVSEVSSGLKNSTAGSNESISITDTISSFMSRAGDVSTLAALIPKSRWIVFEGGTRVIRVEGTNRVIIFEGTNRLVEFKYDDQD